jgi:hypothetical protein
MQYLYRQLREQIQAGLLEIVAVDEVRKVVDARYVDIAERRLKTVWHRSRHDAGAYGADLLSNFLGAGSSISPSPYTPSGTLSRPSLAIGRTRLCSTSSQGLAPRSTPPRCSMRKTAGIDGASLSPTTRSISKPPSNWKKTASAKVTRSSSGTASSRRSPDHE